MRCLNYPQGGSSLLMKKRPAMAQFADNSKWPRVSVRADCAPPLPRLTP